MNGMNYQCPTEFNIDTTLKSCSIYKKQMQESTDPLKYKFDVRPGPMCYMPGQNFQGLQVTNGERRPPPQLLDMEMTLQAMPLKEEENDYIIKDIHNAKPPSMPAILSNRLVIPDCSELLTWQTTKIRWGETPELPERLEKMGYYNTNYMRPGLDTRREWRDKFAKYDKQQKSKGDVYGVGAYDKRPLKPGTNPKCSSGDSSLECMHVYGPNAQRTGEIIDPTKTIADLGATGLTRPNAAGSPIIRGASVNATTGQLVSQDTKQVAASIDPSAPYVNLVKDVLVKNACMAKFYNYNPSSC